MPTLRALPWAQFAVGRNRYQADRDGLIAGVDPDHVGALLNVGCVVAEPWQAPPQPAEPPPTPRPAPPKVKVRARPHQVFGMPEGTRYTADADGIILAAPEHYGILLRAGCMRA